MKFFNIVLSILILLLAAASAVCSYFLYEKRSLLVSGWGEMAKTVNETAAILDKESGTEVAKTLSTDALSHEKYADLTGNLKKLPAQASELIKQRNELGVTVTEIADIMEVSSVPATAELKKVAKYKSGTEEVVSGIKAVKSRQDNTLTAVSKIADKAGVSVPVDSLKSSEYRSQLNKFSDRVDFVNRRMKSFDQSVQAIAETSGAGNIDLSDSTFSSGLTQTVGAVRKLKLNYDSTVRALRESKSQLASTQRTVESKDQEITGLKKDIKDKDAKIEKLEIALGFKDGQKNKVEIWPDGSKEARGAVKGNVIDVNYKYGFVVISLGKNTLVEQKVGDKFCRINPNITKDVEMVVARGLDNGTGQYIGKIKLVKINDDCSIANMIPQTLDGRKVKIGDTVYFSNEAIEKMGK